jgi:hypothetical protein
MKTMKTETKTTAIIEKDQTCDICKRPLLYGPLWFFDAVHVPSGKWTWMCEGCFINYGAGLGTGRGQQYSVRTLEKVEG